MPASPPSARPGGRAVTRRLRAVAALTVLALAGIACSDDPSGDDASTDEAGGAVTTTEAGPTTRAPSAELYADHVSEVYGDEAAWICRGDLPDDECRDLDVTVIAPDGTRTVEERSPAADPPIDCFHVYPTVSLDPGPIADMTVAPGDNEVLTVVAQAAQFARSCRVFAPIYRQATVSAILEGDFAEVGATAYTDVVDAWKKYVSTWNDGRGVILIGHSQGMGHLKRLIADEVDDDEAVRSLLVAAYLFGGAIQVPPGEAVGGDFEHVPGCTAPDQTGCVVTWSTYAADRPAIPEAIFGRAGGDVFGEERDGSTRALCVDAVGLLGRDHATPIVPKGAPLIGGITGVEDITTRFATLPDALDVECDATERHDFLAARLADPDDPRPLDGLLVETLGAAWGLHLVDMTVALEDLVALAQRQGAAYAG